MKKIKNIPFFLVLLFSLNGIADEYVVLLHGLARTSDSMNKMEKALAKEGYKAINFDYPSREHEIAELAEMAVGGAIEQCNRQNAEKIHFVTHSLGGILVRAYLTDHKVPNMGRTVMLAPPNRGSEVVDKLKHVPGFKFINGPAGLQLGTGEEGVPSGLGPANFEVGIIAGTQSINVILSMLIPSKDDGKVSLERVHLENESDFLSLPVSHAFIMKDDDVIKNVIHFLKTGAFIEEMPHPPLETHGTRQGAL